MKKSNKSGGYIPGVGSNPLNNRTQYPTRRISASLATLGRPPATPRTTATTTTTSPVPWIQDADCVGQEDSVIIESIPDGRGFRLEAENRCYDVESIAQMRRLRIPLVGPMTRNPFTEQDKRRIDDYITGHPNPPSSTGGKKRKTRRKNGKTKKMKRSKKRKITRRTR
jgi:hypothetical protein